MGSSCSILAGNCASVCSRGEVGRVNELQYSSRSRPVYLVMPLMRSVLSIEERCTAGIARRHAAA